MESVEYDEGTRASKVLNDIKTYFKTGTMPGQSEVAQFHNRSSVDDEPQGLSLPEPDEDRIFHAPGGVEVVQNPTDREYQQMREEILERYPELRGTDEPLLRRTFDEDGNVYYWDASRATHARACCSTTTRPRAARRRRTICWEPDPVLPSGRPGA